LKQSSVILASLAEFCRSRRYHWLEAQSHCWLANNSGLLGDYSEEAEQDREALAISTASGDVYNIQKTASQLGEVYKFLGRLDEALEFNQMSLPTSEAYYVSHRQLWRSLNSITDTLFALRFLAAAEAYEKEALQLALAELHDPVLIHNTYLRLGQIYAGRKQYPDALQSLQRSFTAIDNISRDPATKKLLGLSILQTANVSRQSGDCSAALESYRQASEEFTSSEYELYKYGTHKGKLLCYLRNSDHAAIQEELPTVLNLFEKNRRQIKDEQDRNHFFDTEQDIYDLAIEYEHDRQNDERGFEYAETSRARSLLDAINRNGGASDARTSTDIVVTAARQQLNLIQLRERLPANLQLIQYAVLPERLLIWFISQKRFEVVESPASSEALGKAISEYLRVITRDDAGSVELEQRLAVELHDWVFAPLEIYLNKGEEIAIVPDKSLFKLPFASLMSRRNGRRIVSDYTLFYAPSATVLVLCSELARLKNQSKDGEKILSVGDPAFSSAEHPKLRRLPSAADEARDVAAYYRSREICVDTDAAKQRVRQTLARADVIHFATHYLTDEFSSDKSRLLLASIEGGGGEECDLTLLEIQGMRLQRAKLAILSACQSGIERYYAGEGLIGLSRAFIAAGVPLVLATHWAVESDSTTQLMVNFHRLRKTQNLSAIQALRQAQIDMLEGPDERYHQPYYWAGFFPIGGSANY